MNNTSETGRAVADFVKQGLAVNAEIALEERECPQEVDAEVLKLVEEYGLKSVLASIQSAAWGAAEVHEDTDEPEDMGPFRTRMFMLRLGQAIDCLK